MRESSGLPENAFKGQDNFVISDEFNGFMVVGALFFGSLTLPL